MNTRSRALVAVLCIVVMCAIGCVLDLWLVPVSEDREALCRVLCSILDMAIGALAFALGWWMAGAPAGKKKLDIGGKNG